MSAFDPNRPPVLGPEWQTNGRTSDIPIEPGGEPSPFADLDDKSKAVDAMRANGHDPNPAYDFVDEFTTAAPLCPNRSDISKHLYTLFPPEFVKDYPDAWIEVAIAAKATGWKPTAAEHFSPFNLPEAIAYAEKENKAGGNVYVGPSLRQGTTGPSGRSEDTNFLASAFAWADFDGEGEFNRVSDILKANTLQNAMLVLTGMVPHKRAHPYFKLNGNITAAAQMKAANFALKTLLGTDDVDAPCNLMRLAGTINYPSDDKRGRGYVPELVTLHTRKNAPAYTIDHLTGLAGEAPGTSKPFGFDLNDATKPGRTDDEIIALLEASRVEGKWHNSMRAAIATMIGRDWSDLQIRLACAHYCTGGANDPDLNPLIEGARKKWNKPDDEPGAQSAKDYTEEFTVTPIDPVDLWAKFDSPSLPRGLLPKAIEDYTFDQGMELGCDMSGIAVGALAVCSAAISDDIKIQVKKNNTRWLESARIWVALIGDVSAMKTPTMGEVTAPLRSIDNAMARDNQDSMDEWLRLPADEKRTTPRPPQPRVMMMNTTVEAAQDTLKDSPDGVLLFRDELAGWFGSIDKYSGGSRGAASADRAFWLESYNGTPYTVSRVVRGNLYIPNLSISVLGGIQPGPVRQIAEESVDDGLLQRITPIMLNPAVAGSDNPPAKSVYDYDALIRRLNKLRPPRTGDILPSTAKLRFDDVASTIRRELELKHLKLSQCGALNRKLASHIGKYNGMFARFCVIWHCIEHANDDKLPTVVTENTAKRVANFLHGFLLPHALAFYANVLGLSNDHDRLANVADYILAHKLERITNRDVQRGDRSMRGLKRYETDAIFEQLDAFGWVTRIPGPRPSDLPHWVVNPAVHEKFAARAEEAAKRRKQDRETLSGLPKGMAL